MNDKPALKIFGVGGAGVRALEALARRAVPGASCVAVDAADPALSGSSAPEKIALEPAPAGNPRPGAEARDGFEESLVPRLKSACVGARIVCIVAGLGGCTGARVAPMLARVARDSGALVLAFVTLPFDCEGNRRRHAAQHGLSELRAGADGVVCFPGQKVFKVINENTSVKDAFKIMDELLADAVSGLARLMVCEGLLPVRPAELCALLRGGHGESALSAAEASGPARSRELLEKLFAHPMIDGGKAIAESDAVLVSLVGGPGLTLVEISRVMEQINNACERAQVIVGATIDEGFGDRLAVTLIATRGGRELPRAGAGFDDPSPEEAGKPVESLDSQLVNRSSSARPHSRFVPPPPSLPPEKIEQLMARQGAGPSRARKGSPRLRQGQLPLEIVSKGRFDKSEPTIHKGEDLDVPTYIRRGIPLN